VSKWVKNINNEEEVKAILEARKEQVRIKQREWCRANRDKVNAYKRAKRGHVRVVMSTKVEGAVTLSRYRGDWKTTMYDCPELTYRGKQIS